MRRALALLLCAGALASCAPHPATLPQARHACARGARHVEIFARGKVVRLLGMRVTRSGLHEGFVVRIDGTNVRVEDNADITGPIAMRPGDAIALQGQYACDDGVLHWTHHDPSFRHEGGFVEVEGKHYQ